MTMIFDEDTAVWDGAVGMVRFYGCDWGRTVECGVSREAIERNCHMLNAAPQVLLAAFRQHIDAIRAVALERYRSGLVELCGVVLVRADDLERAIRRATAQRSPVSIAADAPTRQPSET